MNKKIILCTLMILVSSFQVIVSSCQSLSFCGWEVETNPKNSMQYKKTIWICCCNLTWTEEKPTNLTTQNLEKRISTLENAAKKNNQLYEKLLKQTNNPENVSSVSIINPIIKDAH